MASRLLPAKNERNMATGDAKESKDIPPGSKVICVTCFQEKVEGEVIAFDYAGKVIIIKCPSTGKSTKKDEFETRMLNTAWLKTLEITELATKCPQLPAIDVAKVDKRFNEAKFERRQGIDRIGIDVPPGAQRLFNAINKTISDVKWREKNIVVMDEVTIYPPYKLENVKGKAQHSLDHITKIVKKHFEDEEKVGN